MGFTKECRREGENELMSRNGHELKLVANVGQVMVPKVKFSGSSLA